MVRSAFSGILQTICWTLKTVFNVFYLAILIIFSSELAENTENQCKTCFVCAHKVFSLGCETYLLKQLRVEGH